MSYSGTSLRAGILAEHLAERVVLDPAMRISNGIPTTAVD
jgi:hypothetical protein